MSQIKISELTETTSVDEELCMVPVDDGTSTKKISLKNLNDSATASAEGYATAAAASATDASGYKDAAALSESNASTYASNAADSATAAAGSATSASNYADAASASASTASTAATNAAASATNVAQQASQAQANAVLAESWAIGNTGTRAGEDSNNSKYFATQSGLSATAAATSEANAAASESAAATSESNAATSENNAATSESNAATSESNASTSATNAATSATNASNSETAAALSKAAAALSQAAAATSSQDSEAWSVGTRGGVPVPATDPAYNNNAKYWAEAAAGAAGGGVTSFNGRAGIVSSQDHDYAATQVDFDNTNTDLISTDVGNAIKEVARNLSDLDQDLATVAKTGSYNDLSNIPNLATVATSGSYADLSNTPTLGTAAAKDSTNAITSGSTALIESGAVDSLKQTLETALDNKVNTSDIANNLTTTTAGKVLDATQGKALNDSISTTNTAITNNHKVTHKTVDTSSWTADTTSQSGSTLYKKSIALSHVYVNRPSVDISTSSGTGLPTTAQQEAFDLLQYVTVDGTTMYLYASTIPSTTFYIGIEGVD